MKKLLTAIGIALIPFLYVGLFAWLGLQADDPGIGLMIFWSCLPVTLFIALVVYVYSKLSEKKK